MRMASMRESRDSDLLVNTQVQSHALMRRGFGTSAILVLSVHGPLRYSVLSWMCLALLKNSATVQGATVSPERLCGPIKVGIIF